MDRLILIGGGGHGKVVAETAARMDTWQNIAFLDDQYPNLDVVLQYEVLGRTSDLGNIIDVGDDVFVAVGENVLRLSFVCELGNRGYSIPVIIDPKASVSSSAVLSEGCTVFAMAAVNAEARLGRGVIVNTGATIDHDCELGDGVHISPGAHLAGSVRVGPHSWIGTGANVIPGITIGRDVIVGAGSAVISDIPDCTTYVGNPAREVDRREQE